MTLEAGTKLGRYEIRSKLGAGGMGEVYRARDEKLNRDVAIKVLPAALSEDTDRLHRFEQEAQAAGALNHPNILVIYDVGKNERAPYVVSELLEGENLRDRLDHGPLSSRKSIEYGTQIARGLAAAHARGIVHRDLKPDNLFITRDEHVKILDFGLAKLVQTATDETVQTDVATRKVHTDPGAVMGTAGYMAPEQVRGRAVDHRADIFSFGAVLYEMLSGRRAFRGDSAIETLNAILKEEPPAITDTNPNIAPGLERVVWHCLEKAPDHRFQSASDVAFALESLSGLSTHASQQSMMRDAIPVRSRWTRERLVWLAVCLYYYWRVCQPSQSHIFHAWSPVFMRCDSRSPHLTSRHFLHTSRSRLTARRSPSLPATPRANASSGCVHSMRIARSHWAAPKARSRHSGHRTVISSAISQTENSSKSRLRAGVRSICVMFEKTVAARGAVGE